MVHSQVLHYLESLLEEPLNLQGLQQKIETLGRQLEIIEEEVTDDSTEWSYLANRHTLLENIYQAARSEVLYWSVTTKEEKLEVGLAPLRESLLHILHWDKAVPREMGPGNSPTLEARASWIRLYLPLPVQKLAVEICATYAKKGEDDSPKNRFLTDRFNLYFALFFILALEYHPDNKYLQDPEVMPHIDEHWIAYLRPNS